MGEDVAGWGGGGVFGVTKGLVDEFGAERVRDTPISEEAIAAVAVGAAATGSRPVAEIMYVDFIGLAMEPIVNQAAKLRYMFGGKAQGADGDSGPGRRRPRQRRAAQPEPRSVVLPHPRA